MTSNQRWRVEPMYYYYNIAYLQYTHTAPYQIRAILSYLTSYSLNTDGLDKPRQRGVLNQFPVL